MTAEAGTGRLCSYPICTRRYDAAMVLDGQARADGWKLYPSLSLRLCGDHSPLWTVHGHAPTLDLPAKMLHCGCRWRLNLRAITAGTATLEYLGHLHAAQHRLDHPLPTDPHQAARQIAGELVDVLLSLGAWGLHDSRRAIVRQLALAARGALAAPRTSEVNHA